MRSKEVERIIKQFDKHRTNLLRELDSLDHILECEHLEQYEKMVEFAVKEGFTSVCDIGCAYGHQSELCRNRINYIGIDDDNLNFYNSDEDFTTYMSFTYPYNDDYTSQFDKEKTLAISILCLGWECFKYVEDEFDRQFEKLSKDFKASLLYVPIDRKKELQKYFKNVVAIEENLQSPVKTAMYYCNND